MTHDIAALAAAPVTVRAYDGYMSTDTMRETTLGAELGTDHIAWICEQPNPAITASSRARGMWDANRLDTMAAYDRLAELLRAS